MAPLAKDPSRFVETRVEHQTVIMALDTGDFFTLEGTARAIWELIDGTRDASQIVALLAADYQSDAAQIAPEVEVFVDQLRSAGLLRGE